MKPQMDAEHADGLARFIGLGHALISGRGWSLAPTDHSAFRYPRTSARIFLHLRFVPSFANRQVGG
jgi:hypothetical protein